MTLSALHAMVRLNPYRFPLWDKLPWDDYIKRLSPSEISLIHTHNPVQDGLYIANTHYTYDPHIISVHKGVYAVGLDFDMPSLSITTNKSAHWTLTLKDKPVPVFLPLALSVQVNHPDTQITIVQEGNASRYIHLNLHIAASTQVNYVQKAHTGTLSLINIQASLSPNVQLRVKFTAYGASHMGLCQKFELFHNATLHIDEFFHAIKQQMCVYNHVSHHGAHTVSNQHMYGLAGIQGNVCVHNDTVIHQNTLNTDAYQNFQGLLASDKARIQVKPDMRIYNNDVRASHSASITEPDVKALKFLQSRGIDEPVGKQLLLEAFINNYDKEGILWNTVRHQWL